MGKQKKAHMNISVVILARAITFPHSISVGSMGLTKAQKAARAEAASKSRKGMTRFLGIHSHDYVPDSDSQADLAKAWAGMQEHAEASLTDDLAEVKLIEDSAVAKLTDEDEDDDDDDDDDHKSDEPPARQETREYQQDQPREPPEQSQAQEVGGDEADKKEESQAQEGGDEADKKEESQAQEVG